MAKLHKSKTNFTLKRLHQSGNYGNIYERDYTTIVPSIGIPEGQIPIYGSPTFKLSTTLVNKNQKKYNYGDWVKNGDNNVWTLNQMPEPNRKSSKVVLNHVSNNLNDYACYGSAYELVRSSITNIISNFPAELYFAGQTVSDSGILNTINDTVDLNSYPEGRFVLNPFNIDLIQNEIPENSIVSKLRYLKPSFKKYNIIESNGNIHPITNYVISGNTDTGNCLNDGDKIADIIISTGESSTNITIYCFYYGGEVLYVINEEHTGLRIRPKQEYIEEFFSNLSDFEKVLLNRETKYKATFYTYEEDDETGWFVTEKNYKWLTDEGDWNLLLKGINYSSYMDELSKLAIGYDELFSNSIWRDMTHESITNMDLTESYDDDAIVSSSKMKQTINVIGRQFDEIKRYIDNIKNSNTITYDKRQNTPDYFLSDNLSLSGWEMKDILTGISENIKTEPLYSSRVIGFSASDANSEFMRRLSLNFKGILSKKGTKQAIEELMSIFGFHSVDWIRKYYNALPEDKCRKSFIIKEYVDHVTGYNGFNTGIDLSERRGAFSRRDSGKGIEHHLSGRFTVLFPLQIYRPQPHP